MHVGHTLEIIVMVTMQQLDELVEIVAPGPLDQGQRR
jgi:hypothetical protein